ncbi:Shedu anti-phage system protein SduA domain-containing protein [Thermodesulfobacteriota bacterium]
MTQGQLSPENSLDDVKIRIKKTYSNPNVRTITQVVLKDGPRAFKISTLLEVINPQNGNFHHYSLKIDHINKTKAGWFHKPENSVRLEGKEPDEIEKLYLFLHAAYKNKLDDKTGELHLISATDYEKLENILDLIPNIPDTDKLQLIKNLLSQLDGKSSSLNDFVIAFEASNENTLRHIAAASRMVEYTKALNELRNLVNNPFTGETKFQKHLEVNPWMFGSEYSELLSRKTWTRDDRLDYMLRKTVDDYLEIVEIKTAFPEPLFLHDNSHDSYYPSSKLSPVIGQVTRYIEEVERNRDSILAKDGTDTLKIRARAIVGRDGSTEHQAALRNFNAHLHRIEIITYDQLLKIAERVLAVFGHNAEQEEDYYSDIPF